ncbi:flippase [Haloplanus halobius]|uniref:flippase n=1 Tax=Haloplanus halobius TaxID=2934938 RepID=UPI00200BB3A3|nr:flippase [Haloplanus sp. XH21]
MRLGQTSIVFFLSRITASLLGFGATLYFARELGAGPLGIYSLVLGVVAWLSIAGTMGVPAAVTKRVSEGDERGQYVTAGAVLVVALLAILLGGVVLFRGWINTYVGFPAATFVGLILLVSVLAQVILSTIQGLHLVQIQGLLSPLQTGVRSGLQIGVLFLGGGLIGLFLGYAAGHFVALLVGALIVSRHLDTIGRPTREHLRSLIEYAKFAWMSNLRSKTFNWVDIIVLGFFVSSSLVGIYAVAWNIAQFLILFSSSIAVTIFPEMSQLAAKEDPQATADLFEKSLSYAGLLLIPGVVGSLVVGERLLRIYGGEFTQGVAILALLVVASLIQAYQDQVLTTLNAVDRPDIAFRVNALFLVGNVLLNLILIYVYGWVGAAIATGLSAFLSLVAGATYLRTIVAYDLPLTELSKQWVAALVMGIVVYGLRTLENTMGILRHNVATVLLLVGVGAGVYFTALVVLSEQFRTTIRENLPVLEPYLGW